MPLHFRGTKEERRAAEAYVKLVRCANAVSRRLGDHLRKWDLSENQFGALEAVWHLGPLSPTVLGDYVAGPSHTLPTGGAGVSFGGLTVDQFQRRTSVVEYTRASLLRSLKPLMTFAEVEGLDAHGRSAALRARRQKPKAKPRTKAARSRSQ